ncbi:MAG: PAS domain S-box protein [Rhodospirillum sp.]|nr:PAS domain S-box protein [Rhodospirillum sp.]MCF8489763.1 PAS domain S-box protein [Rhodospirillum sp.]MCF8501272.1 PAS domain S-box protein [Rhodospirillum sp.]
MLSKFKGRSGSGGPKGGGSSRFDPPEEKSFDGEDGDPFGALFDQVARDQDRDAWDDGSDDGNSEVFSRKRSPSGPVEEEGDLDVAFGFAGPATEDPRGLDSVSERASSNGLAWLIGGDVLPAPQANRKAMLPKDVQADESLSPLPPLSRSRDTESQGAIPSGSGREAGPSSPMSDPRDGLETSGEDGMVENRGNDRRGDRAPMDLDPEHRAWLEEAARHIDGLETDDLEGAERADRPDDFGNEAGVTLNAGAAALEELRGALGGHGGDPTSGRGSQPTPLGAPNRPARKSAAGGGGSGRSANGNGEPRARLSKAMSRMEPEAPGFWHRFTVGSRLGLLIVLGLLALGAWAPLEELVGADRNRAADRLARAEAAEALVPLAVSVAKGAAVALAGSDPSLAQPLMRETRRQLIVLAEQGRSAGLPQVERGSQVQADTVETLTGRLADLVDQWRRVNGPNGALSDLRVADRALEKALAEMPFGGSLAAQGTRLVALGRAYLLDGEEAVLGTHAGVLDLFRSTADAAVFDTKKRDDLVALAEAQARALAVVAEGRTGLTGETQSLDQELVDLARSIDSLGAVIAPARAALAALAQTARGDALRRTLILGGMIALIYLLLAWTLARTVTRPLNRLADAVSGLSIDASPALLPGLRRRDQLGSVARSVQDHRLTGEEQAEYLRQQAQAAKAYLSAVLDGAPEAMITVDERGTIVGFNPAAEDMFGYPSPQALGRSVAKLMPGGRDADLETGSPWFRPQDEEERHNPVRRVHAARADGKAFPAELTVLEAKREIGGVLFVLFLRDLSGLDSQVRDVEKAKGLADEARAAHGQFLNVLANELAYPVKGLNIALGGETPDLERSEACLVLLNAITNDVRGFANLEGGLVDLNFAPVNIRMVCESARNTIADLATDFGLDLSVSVEPDVPVTLLGDDALMETVVANLLECVVQFNAIDPSLHASQPGAVVLSARLASRGRGAPRLRFEVGCDHKAVVRSTLDTKARGRAPLSPAARLRLDAGGQRGRTGMVLSITKRLVQLMHGEVGMESWPGRGTVLWFELDA